MRAASSSLNFWSEVVFLLLAESGASAWLQTFAVCCAMQTPNVEFLDYRLGGCSNSTQKIKLHNLHQNRLISLLIVRLAFKCIIFMWPREKNARTLLINFLDQNGSYNHFMQLKLVFRKISPDPFLGRNSFW